MIRLLKGSKGSEYVTADVEFPESGECHVTQYAVQLASESSQNRQTSRKRRVLSHAGSEGDAEPMPPKAPATQFGIGTYRVSEDGSVWVTAVNGNSSNFWQRVEVEDAD